MALEWHHKKTEPFITQGKDTTRNNFSREERTEVGILIREGLQNPLDARHSDTRPVRVTLRHLKPGTFDANYLAGIITDDFRARLRASSGVILPPASDACVFVIEDFGTNGLLGDVEDVNADGDDQNWNAFWHREGEGAKGRASNGGAGQGKVTYFSHSDASVVLGLTVRATDKRRLLMGRAAFLRDYRFNGGAKYYRTAYFTASSAVPKPEERPAELERFSRAFSLQRQPNEPGLSLVLPYAKDFEDSEAIVSVVLDFYMPIVARRLEVSVGGVAITADTIDDIAERYVRDADVFKAGSSFSKDFRAFAKGIVAGPKIDSTLKPGWNKDRTIPDDMFPEGDLERLREALDKGHRVGVRLPLTIKLKEGGARDTTFDVFLEAPPELERNEEAFVRRDLLIGAETHVAAGAFVQKTRSLTWIQDRDLSDFLLAAEEPTHLKWNASLARDKAAYVSPDVALRSIRQAVPRLLAVLLSREGQKDFKSLARFFAKPAQEPTQRPTGTGGSAGPKPMPAPNPPPPPARRPFRIESETTSVRVVPNGKQAPTPDELPISASLELAYEGLDQSPFDAYDPFDFDLAEEDTHDVTAVGVEVRERQGNRIEVDIVSPEFCLSVSGFDPNVRLRARLTYDVKKAHAADVEEGADA